MNAHLEDEIRDALHARARAVHPGRVRAAAPPRRRRRPGTSWSIAGAVAAVALIAVVVSLLAGQNRGNAPSGGASPDVGDTRWRVVTITDAGARTAITSRRVIVEFLDGGEFHADDDVNYYSGKWRATSGGLDITDVAATAVGYAGHDPAVLAAQRGIGALTSSTATIRAGLTGDTLRLSTKGVVLDLVRDGTPSQLGGGSRPSAAASPS